MKAMHELMMGLAFCTVIIAANADAQNTFPATGDVGIWKTEIGGAQ